MTPGTGGRYASDGCRNLHGAKAPNPERATTFLSGPVNVRSPGGA